MNQTDHGTIEYRDEIIRKMIHLCSLSIPIIYYFITRKQAIEILAFFSIVALILDIGRYYSPAIAKVILSLFGSIMRQHELDEKKKNLNGATYVFLSALVCVVIFPKVLFITGFTILIISDTLAALIGRKYGKHRFLSKSLEGTLGFFFSAVIVVFFTPKLLYHPNEYLIGIIAAAVGAIVENVSFGFADDNLSIPLSVGLTMWALYLLLFPGVPLILSNVPV